MDVDRVNLGAPRWTQETYYGRARHFFESTNPYNLLHSGSLEEAKNLVQRHQSGEVTGASLEELWSAKYLMDSAYHPDTGEKMVLIGRMSAQVPMNMAITGCMMTFYKTTPQVVFWQWFNQSFNALVNYTNRAGDAQISRATLGVPLHTKDGEKTGETSSRAAQRGIVMVAGCRIAMAAPGMILVPMFMDSLEKRGVLASYSKINAPTTILLYGFFLTFATPLCCAIFPQMTSIHVDALEPEVGQRLKSEGHEYLYFNKGL